MHKLQRRGRRGTGPRPLAPASPNKGESAGHGVFQVVQSYRHQHHAGDTMADLPIQSYLDVAEHLMSQDETERALVVLDQLPALYRDNVPPAVKKLKSEIKSKIYMPHDYVNNPGDNLCSDESANSFMTYTARGLVLDNFLEVANATGATPHLFDFGPGDYSLPVGLALKGKKFTYSTIAIQPEAFKAAKEKLSDYWRDEIPETKEKDRPVWFIAYEIIEHLHQIEEMRQAYERSPVTPDKVFLSTPRYTFSNGTPDWRERKAHHLRAYTPKEFTIIAQAMFPEYSFRYVDNEVMVLIGEK